jgi:hypothetical protein
LEEDNAMNRIAALSLAVSLFALACSSGSGGTLPDFDSGTEPGDSAASGDSAMQPGNDAGNPQDSATPPVDANTPPPGDSGGAGAFGATCTKNTDCASMLCEPFRMQSIMLCTKACTAATAATDCPNPPSAGTCTPKNYCRFN